MAFELDALVGSDSISLSDGAPFALLSARGMAGPPIRRVTARGPQQHGDTDLGYRLQPREIELEIGFHAATDAVLDGYRDTLTGHFKPLTSTPVNLRVTRDNGDIVRQIDVYTIGQIRINLMPEHRAAHYHRAVIRLRAHDPVWYDPVPGTVTVDEPLDLASDWYLAGGAIGTARVLMQGTAPLGSAEVWSYTGTIPTTGSWTIALRGKMATLPTGYNLKFAFYNQVDALSDDAYLGANENAIIIGGVSNQDNVGNFSFGTSNFFAEYNYGGLHDGANRLALTYYDTDDEAIESRYPTYSEVKEIAIDGTVRVWRKDGWEEPIVLHAMYSPGLTLDEIGALNAYMVDFGSADLYRNANVQLQGDMPDYPIISITGPITNPSIYHTYTGQELAFAGTIGAGTVRVIDLRHGYKTVLEGTVSKRSELSDASDLDTWHLSADFSQGLNVFVLAGENVGTATAIEVVYHHRYSSY